MFARPNDPPERVGVSLSTLDDPASIRPDRHIWVNSKLPWIVLGDGLPQHGRSY